ncbi:M56 family metallopeptidase [Hominisplanchenecus murintestinalis]|uniref:M56 family metallopeptidase n=1 Tax=Hominisplanchenecus murintestinalis TaxID=2941517 RepID=UPI00203FD510|nr:M56 family metallopeptidase [Hominisplanchenecus murintestinalis]
MEKLFRVILEMGITAVPVILAVFAIRMCLLRAPKRYSYLLWGIAGFRLAVPFSVSSALSIFNLGFFRGTSIGRNIAQPGMGEAFGAQPAGLGQGLAGAGALQTAPALQGRASATDGIWQVLMFLWALGVVALLGYFLLSWIQMRRRVEKAVWMQENVWECENIPSPFVMGIFSPKIYIPFRLGEAERMVILSHEQYHIQRRDYLVKIFAYLLLAVYWFHPLVWAAYFAMQKDMEMSCDERVLERIGVKRKAEYSSLLLSFAQKESESFHTGILGFGENGIKRRIRNILNFRHTGRWVGAGLGVVCIMAVCLLGTNGRVADTVPESQAESDGSVYNQEYGFSVGVPEASDAVKTYKMEVGADVDEELKDLWTPGLSLNEITKEGSFGFDLLSSYLHAGTYEVEGDILTLTDYEGTYHFRFKRIDKDTLEFIQEGSSSVALTDERMGIPVYDGAQFKLTED